MYDELIKDLRENHDKYFARDMEAADAIEELKAYADLYEHTSAMGLKLARSVLEAWPKWIPVSDQLPEESVVIQITDGRRVGHGYLYNGDWISPFCDIDADHVTHWMPLPKPPAKEAEK